MRGIFLPFFLGASALVLGACTTPPSPALETARADVAAVKGDADVLRYAAGEVEAAEEALDRAEEARDEGADTVDVQSLAYVASQRAATARQLAESRAAQEAVAESDVARERALRQSLEQQLAELQAQRTDRGVVVNLAGDVLFPVDQAMLSPGGRLTVARIAQVLNDNPDVTALIEGHTDSDGSDSYNLALSQRRADAVRAELAVAGVAPTRLVARGLGEGFPKAPNSTAAGKQQNRRVEIVLQEPGAGSVATNAQGVTTAQPGSPGSAPVARMLPPR